MKFIQTLYFNKSLKPLKHHFGWAAPEYHLMGWALSCLQLKKLYGKVDLYCNSVAAELLIDKLELPYNSVYITHDNLKIADEKLWALPKIFTYGLQEKPFLHVDGDVFLFEKFPESLLNSELIAQNVEEATNYYLDTQKELMKHFTWFPKCVKSDFNSTIPIKAVNAGILGGNNIEFIKEYTNLAFEYIRQNVQHFSSLNADRFNVFFEQHLFYSLAKEKKIPIEVLIKDTIMDNQYQHLGDFHEVPCKKNYLHLLGQYKKDEHTCRQMALKLRQLYPEYYFKIISLLRAPKMSLPKTFSFDKGFANVKEYKLFSGKAREVYAAKADKEIKQQFNNVDSVNSKSSTLVVIKNLMEQITHQRHFTTGELHKDFKAFSKKLKKTVQQNLQFKRAFIHGRDLEAGSWFCILFGKDADIPNKTIARCNEINIIQSNFDWAGLLNKHKRIGVRYYEILEINKGEFYNLVIPEVFGDGFSLIDIDEMEKIILENLNKPTKIKNLFEIMLKYADDEIVANHLSEYQHLIVVMLKQLVLKKAIRPIKVQLNTN